MPLKVKVKKLNEDAILPTYATPGAAAFDLYSPGDFELYEMNVCVIGTGIAVEIPEGHVMRIYSRSGHGFNYNVTLSNSVGVIDSDYRGEIKIKLCCLGPNMLEINKGDRIAQAIIEPIPRVEFELADEISETERGSGGFGSTGQ